MSAWLVNEAGLTKGEAGSYRKWTRVVLEHPAIAGLMADGLITRSWLAKITLVTGKIREDRRGEAEKVIAGLAREGQLGRGTCGGWRTRSGTVPPPRTRAMMTRTGGSRTGACGWSRPWTAPGP